MLPCSYGSIINGHLEQELMILAFSILMLSAGRPSLHHWAFLLSVVRIFIGVMPSVIGICLEMISGNQVFCHNSSLNLLVNAPIYDTNAEASKASPMIVKVCCFRILTVFNQRLFSPDSPFTSLIAADNLFSQASASASTAAF